MKKSFSTLLLLWSFAWVLGQNQGSIIYDLEVLRPWSLSKEIKLKYPHFEEENRILDSVANTLSVQVKFNANRSICKTMNEYSRSGYNEVYYMAAQTGLNGVSLYDIKLNTVSHYDQLFQRDVNITINTKDKWDVDYSKTKIIGKYLCYKAKYNGVNLTNMDIKEPIYAWFTLDVPVPIGPTYFCGLPGLVIELVSGRYKLNATEIFLENCDEEIHFESDIEPLDEDTFLKEFSVYYDRTKLLRVNKG